MTQRFEFEIDTTRAVESWQSQLVAAAQSGADVSDEPSAVGGV